MRNTASLAMTILACAQLSTHAAEIGQWELFETSYETQKSHEVRGQKSDAVRHGLGRWRGWL